MKLGLQIPMFTFPGGPAQLGPTLAAMARTAEDAGYDSVWVMDHFFQIAMVGPAEMDMLEAYTTLGFIAAHTKKVTLGTMVTGVTYRHPGILVKQVTTLDVLSGGRAWLGIGAAWFDREHAGLGVPFPPIRERLERLEEALQIANQMWGENYGAFEGKHYQLAETLNVPAPLSRPRPRILIGGGGEKKTLRLVAKYADACNISAQSPEFIRDKLAVLKQHCEAIGRDYNEIEKTVITRVDPGKDGANVGAEIERLGSYAEAGADTAIGMLMGADTIRPFEYMARDVIPQLAKL
ncbi:MAG: LLM class F420-dependent oxidoreductase [Dehalococcoidia bacterium]